MFSFPNRNSPAKERSVTTRTLRSGRRNSRTKYAYVTTSGIALGAQIAMTSSIFVYYVYLVITSCAHCIITSSNSVVISSPWKPNEAHQGKDWKQLCCQFYGFIFTSVCLYYIIFINDLWEVKMRLCFIIHILTYLCNNAR